MTRMPVVRHGLVLAFGYLCGGISTGYHLVRWKTGGDIRQSGSGSSGARNVGRTLGATGYMVTAAGDIAKGMAITATVQRFCPGTSLASLAAIGAVAGHIWPVQMGFRGGRGLTVGFGSIAIIAPRTARRSVLIALSLLPIVPTPSHAALAATVLAPFQAKVGCAPDPVVRAVTMIAAFVLIGHRHYLRPPGRTRHRV